MAERAAAEAKALRDSGIQMADDMAPMEGNPNRTQGDDTDWASGLDAALGAFSLESGVGGDDRHPEKRLKAVSCWSPDDTDKRRVSESVRYR